MKKEVRAIIMDVDGTLTDGKIYMGENGELMKAFDIKDGCGIHDILPQFEILPIIITARNSKILENRCEELGIVHLYQGQRDKLGMLETLMHELKIEKDKNGIYQEVAYIGDDIIDLECMKRVGVVGCPADAVKEVRNVSDFISQYAGGNGAVREFIEWIVG